MKASEFKKLSFVDQVKMYVAECEITVGVEKMDPAILSDIGTEGLVFDSYVVYLAKGSYDFDLFTVKKSLPRYHVWTEVSIPGTLSSPPDSTVVELLTTTSLVDAITKVLDVLIHERMVGLACRLADSEAAEAEEEYERKSYG